MTQLLDDSKTGVHYYAISYNADNVFNTVHKLESRVCQPDLVSRPSQGSNAIAHGTSAVSVTGSVTETVTCFAIAAYWANRCADFSAKCKSTKLCHVMKTLKTCKILS